MGLHRDVVDPDIHETKGASTAPVGSVHQMVAPGVSGWVPPSGSQTAFGLSSSSGTTANFAGGILRRANVIDTIPPIAINFLVNGTYYVELDPVGLTITFNNTAYTEGHIPLWTVVVAGGVITTTTDQRSLWATGSAALKNASTVSITGQVSPYTLTEDLWSAKLLTITGVLTANMSIVLPNNFPLTAVANATTGAFTLTFKTAAGTGIVIAQGAASMLSGDGTNIIKTVLT